MKTNRRIAAVIAGILLQPFLLTAQNTEEAKALLENERYQSAELLLEKNIASEGAGPELNYLLIKTYLGQYKTTEAKEYINNNLQAAMGEDADPLNRIAYARYLINTGNKGGADEIFASLLNNKKNQKNPSLLIAMAEVYTDAKEGDPKLVLEWMEMAEKKDKNNPAIDILRGQAYRKMSDASNAFLAYQNALKKEEYNVKARYLLGKIFTAQKNPGIYLEHFLAAYQADSTYAPVLEELYMHYYYRDIKLAKKYLQKLIAHSDYSLQNDYYMTDILYLNGEYQEAIAAAEKIIQVQADKSQPRLYKLIAYSYAKAGDSLKATQSIRDYFSKEHPTKYIASDFELRAQLTENIPGTEPEAIGYYSIAAEMDSVMANKANYATKIAALYKKAGNHSQQAAWLGKLYQWKEKTNNIDLFNWGLAHYTAKEYLQTDTVFALYSSRYPDDIYGYYWRAQANAAIDTSMEAAMAIPFYTKLTEIGETNTETHKKMLLQAYGYLGGYEANITKDYPASLRWFEKYLALDADNADVNRYVVLLKKWIAGKG